MAKTKTEPRFFNPHKSAVGVTSPDSSTVDVEPYLPEEHPHRIPGRIYEVTGEWYERFTPKGGVHALRPFPDAVAKEQASVAPVAPQGLTGANIAAPLEAAGANIAAPLEAAGAQDAAEASDPSPDTETPADASHEGTEANNPDSDKPVKRKGLVSRKA